MRLLLWQRRARSLLRQLGMRGGSRHQHLAPAAGQLVLHLPLHRVLHYWPLWHGCSNWLSLSQLLALPLHLRLAGNGLPWLLLAMVWLLVGCRHAHARLACNGLPWLLLLLL